MMKTSGSKRKHLINGSFADERNAKEKRPTDEMPFRESIQKTKELYNGKINTNLVARFLRGNVGKEWTNVYTEIINRIPKSLLHYENVVYWYVTDKVQFIDGDLYDVGEQKFIVKNKQYDWRTTTLEFYVDPDTGILKYISDLIE